MNTTAEMADSQAGELHTSLPAHEVTVMPYGRALLHQALFFLAGAIGFRSIGSSLPIQLFVASVGVFDLALWGYTYFQMKRVFGSTQVPNEPVLIQIFSDNNACWRSAENFNQILLECEEGWKAWLGILKERKFPGCDFVPATPCLTIHGGTFSEHMPRRYFPAKNEDAFTLEFPRRTLLRWGIGGFIVLAAATPFAFFHDVGFVLYSPLFLLILVHQIRCIRKSVIRTKWDPNECEWQFEMFDGTSARWSPKETPMCPIGAPRIYGPFKKKAGRYSRFDWLLNRELTPKLDAFRDELLFNYYSKKPQLPPEETKGWWP